MLRKLIINLACLNFIACGSTDFSAPSGGSTVASDEPGSIELDDEVQRRQLPDSDVDTGAPLTFETKTYQLEQVTDVHPIDIVFAVDTSGSMDDEKEFLERNMERFVREITNEKDIDYRVIVVGDDFAFNVSDPGRMVLQDEGIGSTDALRVIARMIEEGELAIRPEAKKHFIFITDDEARRVEASHFIEVLKANDQTRGNAKVHGLVGLDSSVNTSWCTIDSVGYQYDLLTRDEEYGGLLQDLCKEDWGELLSHFARDIVNQSLSNRVSTDVRLDTGKPYAVYIDDERLSEDDFAFDAEAGDLEILEENYLSAEATLTIKYFPQKN